jgi:guanylate kinase
MQFASQGKLIIITAPSGSGKTSITRYLINKYPKLAFSISATTRAPRGEEKDGAEYYFLSVDEFKEKIDNKAFIEWEMVYEGKYYGTLRSELERMWVAGQVPMLDIDVQGAVHVQQRFAGNCLSIFIQPPSIEELRRRLQGRGTETPESLETRANKASYEMSFSHQFNKTILNDQLEKACIETEEVIKEFLGW